MAYKALDKMREKNCSAYPGFKMYGPSIPAFTQEFAEQSMEYQALKFIREDCENLRFRTDEMHENLTDLDGTSLQKGQIPLHMQYDLDRLCMENALARFFRTGLREDAFDVYFCYIEMFFRGNASSRRMVELLSDYEVNSSPLLDKHRDHYTHSVYVFALGLAIFRNLRQISDEYASYYALTDNRAAAHHFLRFWGFTALFHDIGYPFELAFEQVKSYFSKSKDSMPFVAYRGLDDYIPENFDELAVHLLTEQQQNRLGDSVTLFRLFAEAVADKLYNCNSGAKPYREFLQNTKKPDSHRAYRSYLANVLKQKGERPDCFGFYMDHALFSASILLHSLGELLPLSEVSPCYTDALTAILLHNSLYQHSIREEGKKLALDMHPLAYLLMLCDELQCWNRRSYGRNTRQENHPFGCRVTIGGNCITATYFFSSAERTGTYQKMIKDPDHTCAFLTELSDLLRFQDIIIDIGVSATQEKRDEGSLQTLSNSSYLHLYDFAVALNAQYLLRNYADPSYNGPIRDAEENALGAFSKLSLEYKLSNIAQAKAYGRYLQTIGCFYSDRELACEQKTLFTEDEINKLGELEHQRWMDEKTSMGWMYGDCYMNAAETPEDQKKCRERMRLHRDMKPFQELNSGTQMKDTHPMNDMMWYLKKKDGIRVYQAPK